MSNRQIEIEDHIPLNDYKTTIDFIEKRLHTNVLNKYEECKRHNKICKSSLFKFWNKCKNKVDNILVSQSSNIDDSVLNSLRMENSNSVMPANNTEEISKLQVGELELTLGTNTLIEGMIDIENIPIEIEGVTLLMQNILGDTNEKCITLDSCVPVADGHQDVKNRWNHMFMKTCLI